MGQDDINGIRSLYGNRGSYSFISGPPLVCSSGLNFTLNYLPPSCTFTWTYSTNNLQFVSNGSNYITLKAIGNGTGWVAATINSGCGTLTVPQFTVPVGTQTPSSIEIQMDAPPYRFTASTFAPTATSYNWYKNQVLQGSHDDVAIFTRTSPYCGHSYLVQAEAINACGTSARRNKTVIEPACGKSLVISPNPASDFVEIEIISDANVEINSFAEFNISITDIYGLKVYNDLIKSSGKFNISVSNLNEGSYILTLINGKDVLQATIIIKH